MLHPPIRPLALVLLLVGGAAHAQPPPQNAEVFVPQAGPGLVVDTAPLSPGEVAAEVEGRLGAADRAFLDAALDGDGNATLVRQTGSDNGVSADQQGRRNVAVFVQDGHDNTAVLEQTGQDNVFGAWVVGDGNQIDVTQRGDENVYLLDFRGDHLDHTVVQDGDRLQLVQTGRAEAPFSVEQQGSDASIIIRHNED